MLVSGGLGESENGGPSMNIVPRSGGNTFAGQAFFNTAGKWSTGDNLDDELRAAGIEEKPGIINAYDASGSLGGPIKRDRLWFYGSYRKYSTTAPGRANVRLNAYAGDFSHWDYLADEQYVEPRSVQGRDIWSAAERAGHREEPRDVLSGAAVPMRGLDPDDRRGGLPSTHQPTGSRLGSNTLSPEANTGYFDLPYWVTQATWSNPLTNRVLLEAGYSRFAYKTNGGTGIVPPDGIFDQIPVTEQSAIDGHNANFTYRVVNTYNVQYVNPNAWRASVSYVTGAHSVKVGYQGATRSRHRVHDQSEPARLPVPEPGAEPVHVPAAGLGDVRSHGDRSACTSRTAGRAIVSACRARSATIRPRASARPKATARPRSRASTPRRLRSSGPTA